MAEIDIRPATAARFDDAQHALGGGGDGRSCQCQWWMLSTAEWKGTTQDERRDLLRGDLEAERPTALIAYVDDEPAGWVKVSPRPEQPRLARTRAFQGNATEPWDDTAVWAVSCFVVRKEHRGAGLSRALLDAAVAYASAHGAQTVEAYPVDPAANPKRTANEMYLGVVSTFLAAGFREIARPKPDQAVVALDLST
jgi:GNAT superfamily N-acetyltransferase